MPSFLLKVRNNQHSLHAAAGFFSYFIKLNLLKLGSLRHPSHYISLLHSLCGPALFYKKDKWSAKWSDCFQQYYTKLCSKRWAELGLWRETDTILYLCVIWGRPVLTPQRPCFRFSTSHTGWTGNIYLTCLSIKGAVCDTDNTGLKRVVQPKLERVLPPAILDAHIGC